VPAAGAMVAPFIIDNYITVYRYYVVTVFYRMFTYVVLASYSKRFYEIQNYVNNNGAQKSV